MLVTTLLLHRHRHGQQQQQRQQRFVVQNGTSDAPATCVEQQRNGKFGAKADERWSARQGSLLGVRVFVLEANGRPFGPVQRRAEENGNRRGQRQTNREWTVLNVFGVHE